MNGFIGEFLVLSGAFQAKASYGMLATTGVIWSAAYMLWVYERTFYGVVKQRVNQTLSDVNARERLALIPLAVFALVMGVASPYWMKAIDPSTAAINSVRTVPNKFLGDGGTSNIHPVRAAIPNGGRR